MLVLVANLGSTSFKYSLFRMDGNGGEVIAKGGYERVTDYAAVIDDALAALQRDGVIASSDEIEAVGFKTVLGKNLSGCVIADQQTIAALEGFTAVAPAHNPPYAAGIRQFEKSLPHARLVALFETAFYQWTSPESYSYAIPRAWRDIGIRRYGFHGASHKFIAERSAEICNREDVAEIARRLYLDGPQAASGNPLRVVSCHLGGSSSVTGIRNGVAIGSSMGFSPQSGLPQNNRVGDLDSGAIPYAMRTLGISLDEAEHQLTKESGLLGISGVSNDARDIETASADGNLDAQLAIDTMVHSIRHWVGAFQLELGGLDALVFTAGIGENGVTTRAAVCKGLEGFGIHLDAVKNSACRATEAVISSEGSPVKIIVIPANEELVLAREVYRKLSCFSLTTHTKHNTTMAKQAVGLLETRGLACLVVGVDAMLKSANVELVGPMKQVGSALCNAVVTGDVAAVKAALDAGAAAASESGEVVSAHVIARPDDAIDGVLPKDAASATARAPRK